MSKYTFVLFDADATLFDFKRSEHDAVKDCLAFAGLPTSDDVIAVYSKINDGYWKMLERKEITKSELMVARWQSLLDHYGFDFDAKVISELYPKKLAEKSFLMDGAIEICEKLYGKVSMYIVTNGFASVQHGRFDDSPLRKYFDNMFISEEIGCDKPDKRYFDAVGKLIPDYDPQKAIIIGDSLTSDIMGGINAGIDTCWFNPEGKPALEAMRINYTIKDLREIENIVLS